MQCIIVDDEQKDRENLKLLLDIYTPQVSVIDEAWDKKSILSALLKNKPDIVFLDIQLGTGSIFDILNDIDNINFKIVFVSAFDKYALNGYQYNAVDYLLKPVNSKKLVEVVSKIETQLKESISKEEILNNYKSNYRKIIENPKISVTDAKGVYSIYHKDIIFCKSDGNYTRIILDNEKEIIISKNLKHFETKLKAFNFVRIHKSYLINIENIDTLIKEYGGSIIMKNGESLPISRNRKSELYEKMNLI